MRLVTDNPNNCPYELPSSRRSVCTSEYFALVGHNVYRYDRWLKNMQKRVFYNEFHNCSQSPVLNATDLTTLFYDV